MKTLPKKYLIVKLETNSINTQSSKIVIFGAYDPHEDKYFINKWNDYYLAQAMMLFEEYEYIITFKGDTSDIPILERHGVPIANYNHIDIRTVIKKYRSSLLGKFENYSLYNLVKEIGIDEISKEPIDYEIFKRSNWTDQETEKVLKYFEQNLLLTWKLFDYVNTKLDYLGEFISKEDRDKHKHLTTGLTTYTYKMLCHQAGVKEYYDENPRKKDAPLEIQTNPRREISRTAVLLKFNGIIPHTIMQFNLLSYNCNCCMDNEGKFHGKNFYTIKGYYCQKNQGKIEKTIHKILRLAPTDPKYMLMSKLIKSQIYSIITTPKYYSMFTPELGYDCIALVKQQLVVLSRMFEEKGYFVINVDKDVLFISVDESKGQSIEELEITKDEIITYLQSKMAFKSETFDLKVADKLNYLHFVKKTDNPKQQFMSKGKYLYITSKGKIYAKGIDQDRIDRIMEEEACKD